MQLGRYTTVDAIASRDLARAREAAAALGHRPRLRLLRGAPRRPRNRRDLQSPAQPVARPLDHQGRRSRQARPLRKAPQPHRRRSPNPARRPRPHRRQNRRSLHDPQLPAMAPPAANFFSAGRIGQLRSIFGFFSYFNNDPANIRNHVESGGGALLRHRLLLHPRLALRIRRRNPRRVVGLIERDPGHARSTASPPPFSTSKPASPSSPAAPSSSPIRSVQFLGTTGRIEIEIPFNAPQDRPTRLLIDETGDLFGSRHQRRDFSHCRPVHDARRCLLQRRP